MAKIIENEKGFKVIEASRADMRNVYGQLPVCDRCGHSANNGFLVSVLNQWFCATCYGNWMQHAMKYKHDNPYEDKKFEEHKRLFGLSDKNQ